MRAVIRLTRATRFLPWFRGTGVLRSIWWRLLNRSALYRIANFDGDLKLDVNMGEAVGATLWHIPDLIESKERKLFCAAVRPGCTVLDVGANIGMYTLLAAKRGASVFAIELDPSNAQMLRHHIALNGFSGTVTVFNLAASDSEGLVGLRRYPQSSGYSRVIVGDSIPANTIDSLGLPPIDICKMDVEGSELRALHGMRLTIQRSPNMRLLIEYNACCSDLPALLAFLRSHFAHIAIAGGQELTYAAPSSECNLWCWN